MVVEGSASLQVYIHFIQKVKMEIHALSLDLLKLLLARLNKILVMHSGVKEDGVTILMKYFFLGGKWSILT